MPDNFDEDKLEETIWGIVEDELLSVPVLVRPAIEAAFISGWQTGAFQVGNTTKSLAEMGRDAAIEYATNRAAELIGMRRNEDGELVPSSDAEMVISAATRNKIRAIIRDAIATNKPDEVAQAIQDALLTQNIFSSTRAKLIAETEAVTAQAAGTLSAWMAAGIKKIRWVTRHDSLVCPICKLNDNVVVDIGTPFPSGDLHPPTHPRCRCEILGTFLTVNIGT